MYLYFVIKHIHVPSSSGRSGEKRVHLKAVVFWTSGSLIIWP